MDILIQIPASQVERVASAIGNHPGNMGEEVTADNLAQVLTDRFSEEIRRAVQSHEAGQAATAAAVAVRDAQDPLSTKKADTFASVAADVAEARAARAIDLIEIGAGGAEITEVKG